MSRLPRPGQSSQSQTCFSLDWYSGTFSSIHLQRCSKSRPPRAEDISICRRDTLWDYRGAASGELECGHPTGRLSSYNVCA